ncbi:hypothetical protein FB45DRAFT_795155 [Roridomyces roridus]|uniref:NAD(P)-binding protein n=1 Tax=Roridomyces roridus TaxID=1738132 RepID=A0AAD7BPC7_9AGAR|nr:hypothetical protein FB45DRAFT_795155 [Roridomyces roridus]
MPSLSFAQSSNASFAPNYIPVAIFVGGTSGVGQAMAEAFAQQMNGRAHIILIGRSATTAEKIIAGFPAVSEEEGCAHEFVRCDGQSMREVQRVCDELCARLERVNFLVISAAGPAANSLAQAGETKEGLNAHLAMRYFMRYLFLKNLIPLLLGARQRGQKAHFMTVLGAGFGITMPTTDLGLHEEVRRSWRLMRGLTPSVAAVKGMLRGVAYNDGLVAHFAARNPTLAFTHISPGQVLTAGGDSIGSLGLLFSPLRWVVDCLRRRFLCIPQDECAQYMFYALVDVDAEQGMFISNERGEIVGSRVFESQDADAGWKGNEVANKSGVLEGIQVQGYGGSDETVKALMEYTEEALRVILQLK